MAGNARYVNQRSYSGSISAARAAELANTQKPFAAIVSCADSRVIPEVLFDQGLGELFVIRVAGNVVDDYALASLEYAVEHLGVHLIMVVGHERCGAVSAAVKGGELPGHLPSLMSGINPAVQAVQGQAGDTVELAIAANARLVADRIRKSAPVLDHEAAQGKLQVLAGVYDIDSGIVSIVR